MNFYKKKEKNETFLLFLRIMVTVNFFIYETISI